jgi:hypothetical protein
MARNMPSTDQQAMEWLEGRITGWNTNFATIGLTSAQVIALSQKVVNARAAFTDVESIRTTSKAKTQNFHSLAKTMRGDAGVLIGAIKSFAAQSTDPQLVYDTAGVLPADPRSPALPPQQPTDVNRTILADGSVKLSWKGKGPEGTTYFITRRLNGTGAYTFIGQAPSVEKTFVDSGIVPGTVSASYMIQGVRSGVAGPQSVPIVVQFGVAMDAGAAAAA